MKSDKYFHRGKEARSRDLDRILHDGRVSSANRQQWYAGWDEQDRFMRPKPTPEQELETNEALAGLRSFLAWAKACDQNPEVEQ